MKKSLIALAVSALVAASFTRARTLDVAFTYRMGAGFPGDVNRAHPASIIPGLHDAANPIRLYGDPCLVGAGNAYRGFLAGDTAITKLKGVLVRPASISQTTGGMSASFGTAVPPQGAVAIDVIEDGFVMVKCNNVGAGAPAKGGAVFVWCAASAGNDVQGGFRGAASAGNTAAIANAEWNGPADSNGIAELRVWKA